MLIGLSNNLGNIKVTVTFTTTKPRSPNIWQPKLPNFFSLKVILTWEGGGASDPISRAYDNNRNSMLQSFNVQQQEFGNSEGATYESAVF